MALELKTQRDGRLRKTWYGRYEINGQKLFVNLGVRISGNPPESLSVRDEGDREFERSRATAQARLDMLVEEARSKRNAVALAEKIYEIKTGEVIKSVPLEGLVAEWRKIPRRRKLNAVYVAQCESSLERFVAFLRREHPKVREVAQVSRTMALAFLEAEAARGITGKTWNDKLKVLRLAFKHSLPPGCINPLAEVPTRETETVFRKAFTPVELAAIAEAARADEFIRPIIVTGMCTAMRRGDCCLLKWKDVDLANQFITVKGSKTGQTVSIPIFPMLGDELRARSKERGAGDDGYVFPEQAEMYRRNPDGITLRVKRVLAVALGEKLKAETVEAEMEDGGGRSGEQKDETAWPEVSVEETRQKGEAFLGTLSASEKQERMRRVFQCYMGGKSLDEVAAETGVSKTSVSGYLKEIEAGAQCRIVRGRQDGQSVSALLREAQGFLRAERVGGQRRASVRDFHSFRVTWVTLALTAGVPLELVQKVTGHKTTDIVLKHYFQPGREAFREALQTAMPKLLTSGQKGEDGRSKMEDGETAKRDSEMRQVIEGMTAKTWKQDRARLMELLENA